MFDLGRLFRTEDTLVKNARLFLQPFDLIAQPVFVQDLDGVFRLANLAFCQSRTSTLTDDDGRGREFEVQKTVLHDHHGQPDGTIGVLVDDCLQGAERIRRIVDGVRGLSRRDDRPEEATLDEMLETALLMASNELKSRTRVDSKVAGLPPIRCFRPQVEQVLLNLLVNAAQAIDEQGTIRVTGTAGTGHLHIR